MLFSSPALTRKITELRDEGVQVELMRRKMVTLNVNQQNLCERWMNVTEGFRRQRDELRKDLEEWQARAKALESKIEKDEEKYEDLVLRNLTFTNFIHEIRLGSGRVLGIMRNEGESGVRTSDAGTVEKWRRCLQQGCNYREPLKNNNMARHFRRHHPRVSYGPSCYKRCFL